jgi:hypothetical protein
MSAVDGPIIVVPVARIVLRSQEYGGSAPHGNAAKRVGACQRPQSALINFEIRR